MTVPDLLEEVKLTEDEGPIFDSKTGKVILPKGYYWCMECGAATPHSKSNSWAFECKICGRSKYFGAICYNCGWEPDDDIGPEKMYVIRHREDCFEAKKIQAWAREDDELGIIDDAPKTRMIRIPKDEIEYVVDKRKCDCPYDVIYPCLNVFNYSSWAGSTMDCYNAREWSYDTRCPICGEVFNTQDGNC